MCPHSDLPDPPELYDECRVVRPRGELDLTTAPAFARTLAEARAGAGRLFLIVDLSDVTFMDCSALDALCAAWADCRARHGWVRVVRGPASAWMVLGASGLLGRFPRYATAQDAWHGTRSRPGSE
ncbi:STAS domain-containing protein [Streptomyces curacoi]|uniref:ABC transporter n=1 Tax=Streptomyces curacoi TaxID=146536 RepID=A0A117PI88_9ACTN|nr:STAS domain-containing protein [Streptomyces curacoi]KUM80098.1 ABC transporter [Streptomyces curacoi]